jgi:acyl carrier protein
MAMSREEIFKSVRATLVDALGVDDEEVHENATLQNDLGAESIDFLDIVFRLEKNFGIKIPKGELFNEEILNNPDYVDNGRMTPDGLAKLKHAMPHADFSEFEKNPDINNVPDLFTVRTIVNYIRAKLDDAQAGVS